MSTEVGQIKLKYKTQQKLKHIADITSTLLLRVILKLLSFLPYKVRLATGSMFFARVISPFLGNFKRINDNLSFVMPYLTNEQKKNMAHSINRNIGRTIFELFFTESFSLFAENAKVIGPGLIELQAANESNRPIILVSGHYGNYDVVKNLKSKVLKLVRYK